MTAMDIVNFKLTFGLYNLASRHPRTIIPIVVNKKIKYQNKKKHRIMILVLTIGPSY